ncbi:MAG: TonB-dependent receptor [Bacteroidales bacterium]|nr:TonB-dependent receptor [Bacteroidales bacterium]
MKTFFITILFAVLTGAATFAQTISGAIVAENNSPVAFANVVLMASDSSFVDGTITDVDGKFTINNKSDAAAFISISCLGYEGKMQSANSDCSFIVLKAADLMLDEITVSAGLPKTRIKDGATVTDVQNTLLAKVGSTERMLDKIPGVIKTKDGFEVFGKGKSEIYINGVKVRDNNELESIAPENIKNVEVITNPGAQYDAEVKSVIRITTLKPVGEGFGFNFKSEYFQSQNADLIEVLNMNYRKNKLDVFANLRYSLYNSFEEQWGEITNNSNYHWKNTNDVDYNSKYDYIPLTGGFNYQVDEKNSFGAKYTATLSTTDHNNFVNNLSVFKDDEFYDNVSVSGESERDGGKHLLNTYYNGVVSGFSVSFNADFMRQNTEKSDVNFDLSNSYENREIKSKNSITNRFFAQKLVLGHNLFGGDFSFGTETSFTDRKDDYLSFAEEYVPTAKSQDKQQNIAGFLEYGYLIAEKVQLKAGLRYEHINFEYFNEGVKDENASRKYDELFPSASIATQLGVVQTMLSYSEKIRRPTYFELRNSVSYTSRYHREYGDPKLKPAIIRDLSLMTSAGFMQLGVSYTNTSNYIALWQTVEPQNPEVEKVVPINIKNLPTLGIQFAAAPEFGFYSPNFEVMFQKQWLDGVSEGVTKSFSKPFCKVTFENSFSFDNGWYFEVDCYYNGKGNYEYVYLSRDYFNFEAYIEKSFLNDALSVEIGVVDIFYKTRNDIRLSTETGFLDIHKKSDSREFTLTVKYRFNHAKSKYKGAGAGNEERARM